MSRGHVERLKRNRQSIWRKKRMAEVFARTGLKPGVRILDIGGTPDIWQYAHLDADITLLNLPNAPEMHDQDTSGFTIIEADFTDPEFSLNQDFDFAFCNSVIEHIPDADKRQVFAQSLLKVAPAWWVQVPAPSFPIEAHCHMPGWWHYPDTIKQRFIRQWRTNNREFRANQMSTTVAIHLGELKELFPGGEIFAETVAGFTKSWSTYKAVDSTTS